MKYLRIILACILMLGFSGEPLLAQFVWNPAAVAPFVNPPGGQGNYLPINNPTFTGLMTGPTLDLTGQGNTLQMGGNSIASLNANTVALLAGNTNSGANFVATATSASGVYQSSGSIIFFSNSGLTVGQPFSPAVVAQITGTSFSLGTGITFANPTFSGTVTMPASWGGNCPANQYVAGVTNLGVLSCSQPQGGGGGATLPNPTGPYETLQTSANNTPVWNTNVGIGQTPGTGTTVLAVTGNTLLTGNLAVASSGTITAPDGGTWSSSNLTVTAPTFIQNNINGSYSLTLGQNLTVGYGATINGNGSATPLTIQVAGVTQAVFGTTGLNFVSGYGLTFAGVPMGGTCAASSAVTTISATGVPTCAVFAPLNSPIFTGTPSLPTGTTGVTQTAGTSNTSLATTAFVTSALAAIGSMPQPTTSFQTLQSTGPNAAVWNTAVGINAAPLAGAQLYVSSAGNASSITTQGTSGGTSQLAALNAINTNTSGSIAVTASIGGSGFSLATSGPSASPASQTTLSASGAGGLFLSASTAGATVQMAPGGTTRGTWSASGLNIASGAGLTFNGVAVGGACAAGSAVTALSATVVPTCSTMASLGSGLWAPLTNPAGGQNNYLPIANPAFTGTLSGIQGGGDASTWTIAGINTGGGTAFANGLLVNWISGQTYTSSIWFGGRASTSTNQSNAQIVSAGNGDLRLYAGAIFNPGTLTWTAVNSSSVSATGLVLAGGSLTITGNTGLTGSATFNPTTLAQFGVVVPGTTTAFPGFGGGFQTVNQPMSSNLTALTNTVGNGSAVWFNGTANLNAPVVIQVQNLSTGANANAIIYVNNSSHYSAMQMNSTTNTGTGMPADSFVLGSNASTYVLNAANSNVTFTTNGAIGQSVGQFVNSPGRMQGLMLPGYAPQNLNSTIGLYGNATAALSIGNSYFTATNWANVDITGAVYFNGTNWVADGGAGSGATMLALGPGTCIGMYNTGAVGGGAVVTWTNIGNWCGSGMSTDRISNLTSSRMPTVSSGSLTADSRDMFGWVTGITGGQTTITFSEPYATQSNCTLTASGAPYLWFNANQTGAQDTFVCVEPWTGNQCPDNTTVEYQCFGQANATQVQAP